MYRNIILVLSVLLLTTQVIAREIIYPNQSGIGDKSLGYAALKLALKKSESDFNVKIDSRMATPNRVIYMLESGQIDVIDGGYSTDAAKRLELIYLPIDMGLSGWRIFITLPSVAKQLRSVSSINDLKSYSFGQGQGWYDVKVLEAAGLDVITPPKLINLFGMVNSQRFDLLPLGSNEVYELLRRFNDSNNHLIVDNNLTLVYPFGRFFYVRKADLELKQAIEVGLNNALSDGSLLSLLKSHPLSRDAFNKANLKSRTRIDIETPNLSDEFKAIDPKWWYSP